MAATDTFVSSTKLGVKLDGTASSTNAYGHTLGTALLAVDGHKYVFVQAATAMSSTQRFNVGAAYTITNATSGTYITGVAGGVTADQFFWARQYAI